MKRMFAIGWVVGAILCVGCVTVPEQGPSIAPSELFDDAAFAAPMQQVDPAQALAISPQMKHYLEVEIAPQLRRLGRQQGLVDALYNRAQLRLEYESDTTRNAAETFDARAGNCLSLVLMTAALAKQLSLPLTYQALVGNEMWGRSGDLSLAIGHVNIIVAKRLVDRVQGLPEDTQLLLSFGAPLVGRGALMRPVSEDTIVSMYLNNRAVEWLSRGQMDDAYAYAKQAILKDRRFAAAYNTLGVIYQRKDLKPRAEQAFGAALELEPTSRPALANQANLLASQQRHVEAAALRGRLSRVETEPPFMHFDIGRAAVMAGDYRQGRDHLLRELDRDPDYHEFHFWLAQALAGLGDSKGAREHLLLARNNSTTRHDHALYAAKLERLQYWASRTN